jgi:2-deoxy-D-gluconate 3-dehydrogenase
MIPSFDLSGSSAIVTGASTGLGRGMALALASAGADVLLVDHVPSEETAAEVKRMGRPGYPSLPIFR